jgi:hypothetical protein
MIRTTLSYCVLWVTLLGLFKTLTDVSQFKPSVHVSVGHTSAASEQFYSEPARRDTYAVVQDGEDYHTAFLPARRPHTHAALTASSAPSGSSSAQDDRLLRQSEQPPLLEIALTVPASAPDQELFSEDNRLTAGMSRVLESEEDVLGSITDHAQPSEATVLVAAYLPQQSDTSEEQAAAEPRQRTPAVVIRLQDGTQQTATAHQAQEARAGSEPVGPPPPQDASGLRRLQESIAREGQTPQVSNSASEGNVSDEQPAAQRSLSAELLALRDRLRDVLAYHLQRPEAVERRSPWGVMHALIAYGVDTEVTVGGKPVNAIGWLCWNGPCRGQQLFYLNNGELAAHVGPGVQGHEGQFLAMLAQSRVPRDFSMRVEGRQFTVQDLIEYEKRTCRPGTELTFKLIGLAHYLDTDETWTSAWGERWDIPRLIREELAQPIIGAACGGTHRMMGFSYAVRRRQKSGRPMTGQWLRAYKYVNDYHEYTFKLQNPDGSFSTNWFAGPGEFGTAERKLETTGHILEWLVYSLPEEQLTDPRVVKAVTFLTDLMGQALDYEWEIGPKGHALHALAIYDERLFGGQPGKRRVELAQHRSASASR